MPTLRTSFRLGLLLTTVLVLPHVARADDGDDAPAGRKATILPTGDFITPTILQGAVQQPLNPGLPAYPNFVAGEAVQSRLSPDGGTLAIICAGQNSLDNASGATDVANSTQYIFLYDVSGGHKTRPALLQVIKQANAHVGLVWSPDGKTLYAAGGVDDVVYAYTQASGAYTLAATIALNHNKHGVGLAVQPNASGLGISADGKTLIVANNYNDSISVIDTASNTVRYEHDLRPYFTGNEGASGVAGGEYPFAVVLKGNDTAYVSSTRDRQVVALDIASSPTAASLVSRIQLDGNPYGMTMNADQTTLYVAEDNTDQVAAIKTATNTVVQKIDVRAPAGVLPGVRQTGAAPFAVTLAPDGKTLYVVNNGANDIAVVPLNGGEADDVIGLIPTAYAPKDVTFSRDGTWMYIINGKSNTGPNPAHLAGATALITSITYPGGNAAAAAAANASNEYQFQLEQASLVSAKAPAAQDLEPLTAQVAKNNGYTTRESRADSQVMSFLHQRIKHVIYIVKENRTFDQILGDLTNGASADPALAQFGQELTPNFHNFANSFVTLDNFMDPADGSMDGWSWSMRGRITNDEEITQQINYAFVNRGLSYEGEGSNRNVPVGLAAQADRDAATKGQYSTLSASLPGGTANLLPGTSDVAATDFDGQQQAGYIMDAALRAGLSFRNYGFQVNNIGPITDSTGKPITNAGAAGVVQAAEVNPALVPVTDVYFRGFDQNYPDQYDVNEWYREFQQYETYSDLPAFETVRLSHDHTGSFGTALAGVNTPDTQEADNDLAVGRMVDYVAHSRFARNTLFIVTEDDSQDGPDHIDSHRAPAYFVGAYVKKGAIVSTRYSQINALRTIEDILGLPHLNLNTKFARPMSDVFDTTLSGAWSYNAVASTILKTTQLVMADTGVKYAEGPRLYPRQDVAYWAAHTKGFDFSVEDRVPSAILNRVLWDGTRPGVPYPAVVHADADDK